MGIEVAHISHAAQLARQLEDAAAQIVRDTCADIRDEAQARSAVLTGAQQASIYVSLHDGSDYAEAVAAARGKHSAVDVWPEIAPPDDPFTGYVAVAVVYASVNEFQCQEFLAAGTEAARARFEARCKQTFGG